MNCRVQKKNLPLVLTIILGFLLYLILQTNLQFKFVDHLALYEQTEYHVERCQNILNDLDRIWDSRRNNRIKTTKGIKEVKSAERNTYDFFEPEAVCLDDERFGGTHSDRYMAFGDGPKFLCGVDRIADKKKSLGNCLIYSVGSNNQIHFELAVKSTMRCETHTFDPTINSSEYVGWNLSTFHEWGFGESGKSTILRHRRGIFKFIEMSIEDAMNALNHTGRVLDILKIDCEGCEYVAVTEVFHAIAAGRIRVNQIQVEVHGLDFSRVKILMEAADAANMRIFHKERNHWGCDGQRCVEYAFISADFLREANAYYICHRRMN